MEIWSYDDGEANDMKIRQTVKMALAWIENGVEPVTAFNGSIFLNHANPGDVGYVWFEMLTMCD